MARNFNIFGDYEFDRFQSGRQQQLRNKIRRENPDRFLNINEAEYINQLVSEFTIDPLILQFDKKYPTTREELISADRFPPGFGVEPGRSYPKSVIRIHIPFTGDEELLHCIPNPRVHRNLWVTTQDQTLCLDVIAFYDNERMKREVDAAFEMIKQGCSHLSKQIENYNQGLPSLVKCYLHERRQELIQRNQLLNDLGLPVKKADNIPPPPSVPIRKTLKREDEQKSKVPDQTKPKAIEVFYSYSHKDEGLRNQLEKHLSVLNQQGIITGWHDRKIGAGKEWEGQINEHLNSADIILLLISADFLASGYCSGVEMERAMERHEAGEARVIPIILRPVDWKGAPFEKLQALPKDARPVTNWRPHDKAFQDIAKGIRSVVNEWPIPSTKL